MKASCGIYCKGLYDPTIIYVGTSSACPRGNVSAGIGMYKAMDGGKNWSLIHHISEQTGAVDLSINLKNPREIYTAIWRTERKSWTLIDGEDLWKTMDAKDLPKLKDLLEKNGVGQIMIPK